MAYSQSRLGHLLLHGFANSSDQYAVRVRAGIRPLGGFPNLMATLAIINFSVRIFSNPKLFA